MPPADFTLIDGMHPRPFKLVTDRMITKKYGEPPAIVSTPESVTSIADLEAYLEVEELANPYTKYHLFAEPLDLTTQLVGDPIRSYRSITPKIAVKLAEHARTVDAAGLIAAELGFEHLRDYILDNGYTAFRTARTSRIFERLDAILAHPDVADAQITVGAPMSLRTCEESSFTRFFPNDEFYGYQTYFRPPVGIPNNPWDPVNPWALPMLVRPVWENALPPTGLPFLNSNYTGSNVTVGIADDGLHTDHPDLRRNINRNFQNDWIGDDSEPTGGSHGTRAGGLIGMIGRNRIGFTGVAPQCRIAGLRFFPTNSQGFLDDEQIAEVFDHRSGSIDILYNGWGPGDNFINPVGPGPLSLGELEANVGRRDRIFVIGAGNGSAADNSNADGFANSIYTIAVGAIQHQGLPARYSEVGANMLTSGLAQDGAFPAGQMFSTNGAEGYIRGSMNGTSYAAAMVSGTVALMLEARPDLGWRDVQEILIASSTGVGPEIPNGGYTVELDSPAPPLDLLPTSYGVDTAGREPDVPASAPQTGYGLHDPTVAVALAEVWPKLPDGGSGYRTRSRRVVTQELVHKRLGPPWRPYSNDRDFDEYDDFHVFYFDFGNTEDIRVEHVEVTVEWAEESDDTPVDIVVFPSEMPSNLLRGLNFFSLDETHPRGRAPSALHSSTLSRDETGIEAPEVWTYTSTHHWGRSSAEEPEFGVWEVHLGVDDGGSPDDDDGPFSRELRSITVTLSGGRNNSLPTLDAFNLYSTLDPGTPLPLEGAQTNSGENIIITDIEFTDIDFDPVRLRYQWQELFADGATWNNVPGQAGEITGNCQFAPVAHFDMTVQKAGASIFTESTAPRLGEPVQFNSTSFDVDGTIASYLWDFGNGVTSNLENPILTAGYNSPDDFMVSLTVTDNSGASSSFSFPFTVYTGNGFIPNPEPAIPDPPDLGGCVFDGVAALPSSATSAGSAYRILVTPFDPLQDGLTVASQAVAVHSEPVRNSFVGDDYCYNAVLWFNPIPPPGFPRFVQANEVSQGTLGPDANGEWIEFLVSVESDLRGYHLTNHIASFDLTFTENPLWGVIPTGTVIVIYNSEFADPLLPSPVFDIDSGVIIVGSGDQNFFELPGNGDGWGEVSNVNDTYLMLQDRFCRSIDGVAWNTDEAIQGLTPVRFVEGLLIPMVGFIPDGMSAHYVDDVLGSIVIRDPITEEVLGYDGYLDRDQWHVSGAALDTSDTSPPSPRSDGVTPGLVNDTNNLQVQSDAIAADLTSIPRYSIAEGPAWLTISEFAGKLSGTPPEDAVGMHDITVRRSNSFTESNQSFVLSIAPGPPLDPDGDEDGDGISNLLEIAFASDPEVPDSPADVLPTVATVNVGGDTHVGISYRQPNGGDFDPATGIYTYTDTFGDTYVYEVQCSLDLETWTPFADLIGTLTIQSLVPDGPDANLITFRMEDTLPGTEPRKFLRVALTRTSP